MTKHQKVAVIELNYNGENFLDESLSSLTKQTYSNMEIYIADGGSSDNSFKIINKYKKVNLINCPVNQGIATSSNYAAKKIDPKSEYIVFVSNDMKFDKNCISELVQTIESDEKVGFVTAVLVKNKPDEKTGKFLIDNAGIDLDMFGFVSPHYRDMDYEKIKNIGAEEVMSSCGGCFIIKKSLFEKLDGFDESFWALSEDIDLSWRVKIAGYKVMVNTKAFLYHHISPTLGKIKMTKTRYLSERNNLTMLLKNYDLSNLLVVLPIYLLQEFFEILFFLVKLRPDVAFSIVRAVWYNIVNINKTLQKRKTVQSNRKLSDSSVLKLMHRGSYKTSLLPKVVGLNFR